MGIEERITHYLSSGGLFNPEMMEHVKVRDLLMDCRTEIEALNKVYVAAQSTGLGSSEWANRLDVAIAEVKAITDEDRHDHA